MLGLKTLMPFCNLMKKKLLRLNGSVNKRLSLIEEAIEKVIVK